MKRFLVKLEKNTSTSSTSHEQQTNINAASTSSVNDIDLEGNNNPKKLKGEVPSTSLRRIAPVTVDLSISIKDGPKQPKVNYPRRNIGGKQRSFQSTWYDKYSWMEYSVKNDAIFCFFCRHFSATEKKTNHSENHNRESLTNTGFNDWKNISKMAEKHENSNFHKNCLTKYKGWLDSQQSGSVSIKINEHMAQTVEKNRQTLKTLIRSVLFCARQDIALRGHREVKKCYKEDEDTDNNSTDDEGGNCPEGSNRGNFKELVNLLCLENSDFDTNLKNMPKNAKYTSKDIQNDILDAASKLVTKGIVDEINASNIYSIIVDEARDEGCKEQMSICCRYIHESKIKERFLGFVELQELTAESLASKIKEFLESIGLDLKNCVSQSFDGASVMSGRCNGLHTLIREMANNPCFYVHCHAHRLNLVLVDVAKNVKIIGETMGLLEAIYAFQSCSTLRHELFVFSKETETGKKIITVPQHSDTRWVAKYKGVQFFKNQLGSVINALQKCALSTKPREAAEARGLLAQIKSFDVAFALVCLEGILQLVNILSKQLQSSTIDIGKCIKLVKATIDHLGHLRTDTQFAKFIQETQELCKTCNIDLNTDSGNSRRKQKPTGSLDAYVIMDTIGKGRHEAEFESNFMKLKAEYFSILDNILGEMGKRFNDNDLPITCLSACDPKSPDFLNPQVLCSFAELQGKDTDFLSTLKVQCGLGKSMFGSAKDGLDVLKDLDDFPSFKELKLIMTILMAMPVSTATAERTFSTMRRIKSNLRATMTGKRLSSLGVLSIENEASYELLKNPEPVIDEFASQKGRRLQFVMK